MATATILAGAAEANVERIAGLCRAAAEVVSEADIARIMRAMVEKAAAGSVNAARIVLQYAIGKPAAKATTTAAPLVMPAFQEAEVAASGSNTQSTVKNDVVSESSSQDRAERKGRSASRSWVPSLAQLVMNNASLPSSSPSSLASAPTARR